MHLPQVAAHLSQGVQHLGKGARPLAWKIHPSAQVPSLPTKRLPHYCAVARLRGCAVARLRGCAVAKFFPKISCEFRQELNLAGLRCQAIIAGVKRNLCSIRG